MSRALVLGGGGPVGIGWESGLVVGLAERGVDLAAADALYGTSAGAFVGAELALGADLAAEFTPLLETYAALAAEEASSASERMGSFMTALAAAVLAGAPPQEMNRSLGRLALASEVPSEEEFLRFFAALDGREWPERLACTALDTATGEFTVWRKGSDAELKHAVASSCAVPLVYPPVTIGGRRFMDGGLRSVLNVDLATGHDRVLVVSALMLALPAGVSNPIFDPLIGRLGGEIAALRASGSAVEVIEPNSEFLELSGWGSLLMDLDRAAEAYEAGIRQGVEAAGRVGELWNRLSD
jgi:NTE family protein